MSAVIPKAEYPRPDLDRSHRWTSLNGEWSFESIDGRTTVTVPFAWETPASGVRRTWLEHAVYERSATVPDTWGDARAVLCFGAVHHEARIFVDGRHVGTHVGGYTSFEFDISSFVTAGSTFVLRVEVDAPADKRAIVHGKQRSIPRDDYDGVSFTPTSGIWQSVWLEGRGRTYVDGLRLRGDRLDGIDIDGRLLGDAPADRAVTVRAGDVVVELTSQGDGRFAGSLDLPEPRLWSPEDPHLYRVEVAVGDDERLVAWTGLRRIETRGEELYLNGERLYVRGVLDQGYWPETGLTAPDDDALVRDLELARELGFNLVRKHLKFEEPRWLAQADRMGMLVWAEPACPSRFSDEAAVAFEAQLAPMVERDGNHPSIVIWGLYNEEWGLDWDIPGSSSRADAARRAYDLLTALDSTRPVVENSGWAHVRSDLVDWHYYDDDPASWARNVAALADGTSDSWEVKLGPDFIVDKSLYGSDGFPRHGVPILNSEFGGGFTSLERAWHVRWQTQEIRRHDRFAGYVYTELTDVEHEMAGLLDVDRRPKDWGGHVPAHSNAETVIVLDVIPLHAGADIRVPDGPTELAARVSHHGRRTLRGTLVAAWAEAGSISAERSDTVSRAHAITTAEPFRLSAPATLLVPSPGRPARLHVWFEDESGEVLARTFLDAAPVEEPNRRGARES